MAKFMFIYRDSADPNAPQPSAEEMQQFLGLWGEWFAKVGSNLVDGGDGLLMTGRVLKPSGEVANGPYVEAKEVISGYTILEAEHYEAAIEFAKSCPIISVGGEIEIRELAGYV